MKNKILFIGTSHLGAIKEGWYKSSNHEYDASFLGISFPEFAYNLDKGWLLNDGVLKLNENIECFLDGEDIVDKSPSVGGGVFEGSRVSKGVILDIKQYDSIVFVDMFFRVVNSLALLENDIIISESIPVSHAMIHDLRIPFFNGWVSFHNHKKFGSIPFRTSKAFIESLSTIDDRKNTYLMSAPRFPEGNISVDKVFGTLANAKRSYDFIERFYESSLSSIGVKYIKQSKNVLDEHECFSRSELSRGRHPSKADKLDTHMGMKFGQLMIEELETYLKIK